MGKYDFIKEGNVLFWHDPDNGLSDGVYQVVSVPEVIEDDSIILIAASGSEAEVYPTELSPINSGRSYKKAEISCDDLITCFILFFRKPHLFKAYWFRKTRFE